MAYLTQFSGSVPVIKFTIDQSLMTIGQALEMDICVPEEGISDNHAELEAVKHGDYYRFQIKSREDEPQIQINGKAVASAELNDGDWIIIGDVEFQFTDDGIYDIKQLAATKVEDAIKLELVEKTSVKPAPASQETITVNTETIAAKPAEEDHRFSRRLNFF